jgi:acyl-CoA reductase-like NAD-dependent aldehyde dehydrogenase
MDYGPHIARQRAFFLSGATATPGFRRDRLRDLESGLIGREPELLAALRADLRKNPHEAYASEIGFVLGEVRHAIKHLPRWVKPERRRAPFAAWPSRAELRHEAYGVSLIIGPWNYPLQLLLAPLVGAIAAGNTAVLKPSEFAPHTAAVISAMIKERFEEDFIAVVEGARDCAEALLREKFDKIFFTGSTGTGRLVMAAAARHLTPVTLELGGKCPCIVAADAPVELTARRIVWGKFMNAGQTCVAPDHLWVDRRIGAPLLDAMRREIRRFYGENPQHSPDYGRIVNDRHFDRLQALLADGRIIHGGRADAQELYIEPTILTDVAADCAAMRDEIFGPILPVMEFDEPGEVLAIQRNLPPPLALYLFTADRGLQERLLSATRSGGVCINDTISHIIGNDLPFGGVGESGMGTYHGRAGFDCFSHPRSVLRRSLRIDPAFRYPPPQASLATLKRVMRYFS